MPTSPRPNTTRSGKTIWVFTPSRTDPKDLESILVQRHDLLKDAVERVRESALTAHKHHLLFVGPRGCGKTHLVTLIVSRLGEDAALKDKLRLAWLNEDETCTSFLELLVKVHAALEKRYPGEFREEMLADAYSLKPKAALDLVSRHLLTTLGTRTLVVVTENLDALFEGLGDLGQKQLRSFIQENPRFSIVATAQRLVEDLSARTSPFFGFFQIEHLKPLDVGQATELLRNIARLAGQTDVVEFLSTSRGRSRVQAIHHLSGGNHRIYIVLSQFITRDSVDALLEPFMKMVDELTPYYQERIRWLPALQRRIVEYLCTCEATVPVKDIARKLFTTPQTISSQLQALRELGYVQSNQRGRESLYEISEPLMRICVEVKDNQSHQPLRLLVDFLRVWYDDHQLKSRLGEAGLPMETCAYLEAAIQRNGAQGSLRKRILLESLQTSLPDPMPDSLREEMMNEFGELPESAALAMQLWGEGKPVEARQCFEEAASEILGEAARNRLRVRVTRALFNRGIAHGQANETQREIRDYTAVIELPKSPPELVGVALFNRGFQQGRLGNLESEVEDYTALIRLPGAQVELIGRALVNRGCALGQMGKPMAEIDDYTAVIDLPGASTEQVANALFARGLTYLQLADSLQAIKDFTSVIGLPGAPVELICRTYVSRGHAFRLTGDAQREINDYTSGIGLLGAPADVVADALSLRGLAYARAGDIRSGITDFSAVICLRGAPVEVVAMALFVRARSYCDMGETEREIHDYSALISLRDAPVGLVAEALLNRGKRQSLLGKTQEVEADMKSVIRLPGAPLDRVLDAHLALTAFHFNAGHWAEGLRSLELSLECSLKTQPVCWGDATGFVEAVFSAGLNHAGRHAHVAEIVRLCGKYGAIPRLGEAVVKHIGNVFRAGGPYPSADNLEGWASAWEQASSSIPDFRLSMRLLKTAIAFLKTGGKDRSTLLDLQSAERSILEQAFGLERDSSGF